MTNDGTTISYYLNGELKNNQNIGHQNSGTSAFHIGRWGDPCPDGWGCSDTAAHFKGKIDEAAIWNIALSSSQITNLYDNGNAIDAREIESDHLDHYWNFNNSNINDIQDLGTSTSSRWTILEIKGNPIMDSSDYMEPKRKPVTFDITGTGNEGNTISTTLIATDLDSSDINQFQFTIITTPNHKTGEITFINPINYNPDTNTFSQQVTYTHNDSENHSDSFTYQANDGNLNSNISTATITIIPVNDPTIISGEFNKTIQPGETIQDIISRIGDAAVTHALGTTYTDAGATASDDVDGDITSSITTSGAVDTNTAGTYTITYSVSDAAGNAATQITRTVTVADTTAPIISRIGAEITSNTGGVDVFANLLLGDNEISLIRPGAFVRLTVPDKTYKAVVVVPDTSVYEDSYVFVIKESRLEKRYVKILGYDGSKVLIVAQESSELKDGDQVIINQLREAGEGVKVNAL